MSSFSITLVAILIPSANTLLIMGDHLLHHLLEAGKDLIPQAQAPPTLPTSCITLQCPSLRAWAFHPFSPSCTRSRMAVGAYKGDCQPPSGLHHRPQWPPSPHPHLLIQGQIWQHMLYHQSTPLQANQSKQMLQWQHTTLTPLSPLLEFILGEGTVF